MARLLILGLVFAELTNAKVLQMNVSRKAKALLSTDNSEVKITNGILSLLSSEMP